MLDSLKSQRKRRKRGRRRWKKGKNPWNSHFVIWNSRQGGKECGLMQKLRKFVYRLIRGRWNIQANPKRTRFANSPFCGRLERGDIRGNSLFRFCDSGNISSLCFLWVRRWPLMNNDALSRFHILDVVFWYYKNIHCFDSGCFDMEIVIQIR